MNLLTLPWFELAILTPLVGALLLCVLRAPELAGRLCVAFTLATFLFSAVGWLALKAGAPHVTVYWLDVPVFAVDELSEPMLPLVALLHFLTVVSTTRNKAGRFSFRLMLLGESVRLALFACPGGWPLVALLVLCVIPPYIELLLRKKPTRIYVIHTGLFVVLLLIGWAGVQADLPGAYAILLASILVRIGTVPAHLWVADLFEHASFGSALLHATPLLGVYATLRLVLPAAPDWVLQGIGVASLVTAFYAAGMALIQLEARRFFAYLFLSQASIVLVGLELHTAQSLTGALCLWISVPLSLGGLGLLLRALEARHGRLQLTRYHGLYEESPALANSFLLAGLASVGFPGTVGFVAADLLADGAMNASSIVGFGLVLAAAFNGIAIMRVYFLLFTGAHYQPSVPLGITPRERFAVLILAALILGGGLLPQIGIADRHAAAHSVLEYRHSNLGEDTPPVTHE